MRCLVTPSFEQLGVSLNWKRLEERATGVGDRTLFIPGGGYTKSLYQKW